MLVLFTADLHIRLGQKNIPREWALNRYRIMFNEFDRVRKQYGIQAEIHGGDIFDKVPTLEELAVYFEYVASLAGDDMPVYIFDGNHEATKKNHTFMHHLEHMLHNVNSSAILIMSPTTGEGIGDFIPYTHIKQKNLAKYQEEPILFTHVRGEIPPHVKPEIDLVELDAWAKVFAGDLHAHSNSQRNIVYPGSPVTVTFHRNSAKTGVVVLETDTMDWEWVEIQVPQLLRKTVESEEEMVKTEYDHTIYELVGDMVSLSAVGKENDLLDKKIINYDADATLDLTGLEMEDEIYLYLEDIQGMDKADIKKTLQVYNDSIAGADLE